MARQKYRVCIEARYGYYDGTDLWKRAMAAEAMEDLYVGARLIIGDAGNVEEHGLWLDDDGYGGAATVHGTVEGMETVRKLLERYCDEQEARGCLSELRRTGHTECELDNRWFDEGNIEVARCE